MEIRHILEEMVQKGASDLFLRTSTCPRARIDGHIEVIGEDVLCKHDIIGVCNFLLANEQRQKSFKENLDIDFIHEEEGLGRFRVNIFIQRQTPSIVIRHVHNQVRTFEELNLPADLCKRVGDESKGMLLVCGPAGNGKSTTIASLLDYINETSSHHILTVEDPIEYLFKDKKSIINQRELGLDVHGYAQALKHLTQQSPDILFIGNIRDEETMKAAVTATELGTFVMSTFHTINAVQTIVRIVNFFPPHLHDEIRMQLSMILKGIISLRLIPRKDGKGRVPAYETMMITPTIARLIREGRVREIQNFIDEGELFGMVSFKKSLVRMVKEGLIHEEAARRYADSRDDFDLELKGIKRNLS